MVSAPATGMYWDLTRIFLAQCGFSQKAESLSVGFILLLVGRQ